MKNIEEILIGETKRLGIHEHAFIKTESIFFSGEVRKLCERNACGLYGTCWACPPAVGTLEQCRQHCLNYENAFVFSTLTLLENKYDVEKWKEAGMKHEEVTDAVAGIFEKCFKKIFVLSTEGCAICPSCTYPDNPCRFPERMHPATEAYGILVTDLSKKCGIRYNNGARALTFFSVVFF